MDINHLREFASKIPLYGSGANFEFIPNDSVTIFTERVQVKFPKSKKRRIRKKWAKNASNFQYLKVDRPLRIGNKFYVSKRIFEALRTHYNKPAFAQGGILNVSDPQEYKVPDWRNLLFMSSPGGMVGLESNHPLQMQTPSVMNIETSFKFWTTFQNDVWKGYKPMVFISEIPT
ncbi:hypothetical protein GCM10011514_06660 [Emticicia aquatilis]|uniref:Uncharacterized protein n=1 Tax=Emticicia aquatilis TaxID=1537369 RepID=A0A916YI63_9BACT|nr:hypothetical protein [Emticicia aquatilis]GGD45317.1 hypothetical protein GCM10011514_06660 [Emticicia aquatilis]